MFWQLSERTTCVDQDKLVFLVHLVFWLEQRIYSQDLKNTSLPRKLYTIILLQLDILYITLSRNYKVGIIQNLNYGQCIISLLTRYVENAATNQNIVRGVS